MQKECSPERKVAKRTRLGSSGVARSLGPSGRRRQRAHTHCAARCARRHHKQMCEIPRCEPCGSGCGTMWQTPHPRGGPPSNSTAWASFGTTWNDWLEDPAALANPARSIVPGPASFRRRAGVDENKVGRGPTEGPHNFASREEKYGRSPRRLMSPISQR